MASTFPFAAIVGQDEMTLAIQVVAIDPNVLFAPPQSIEKEVVRVLDSFGKPHSDTTQTGPTHIFNLGHGIHQHTPPEHVTALVETVHRHSKKLRSSP